MTTAAPPCLGSVAVARALALGFALPSDESTARLEALAATLGAWADGVSPSVRAAAGALAEAIGDALDTGGLDALAADHETLFGIDGVCAPYEGAFERDPFRETRLLADIAGFYAAFGAEPGGPALDRVDHAGCQLEFLAFVGLRRLAAEEAGDAEAAATCRDAEAALLRDHLGRFLPALCDEISAIAISPVYMSLAALARAWVADELAARCIEPRPVGQRRGSGGAVEDDELSCGDGSACGPLPAEQALLQITRKGGEKRR